jgi:hypothetical protein
MDNFAASSSDAATRGLESPRCTGTNGRGPLVRSDVRLATCPPAAVLSSVKESTVHLPHVTATSQHARPCHDAASSAWKP